MKPGILIFLCVSFISSYKSMAQTSWTEHGKLEISDNQHYIQHEDDTPFLWIGDTGWGMFQQLTREEIDQYLDSRQALGFTVIQAVVHWSPHGGGIDRSSDNAANAYVHRPFTGDEDSPNTYEPLLVEGGNLNSPNDYWDHADYAVEAVKKRHMYLALLPCWASEFITGNGEYTDEEAKSHGAFLGKRYGNEPNIIWVPGGDTKAQFDAYDKNQKYSEYDHRHIYRAMAEGIVQGVTGQTPSWNEDHSACDEVFFTYHPNGDAPYGSSQWFHEDAWQDANGVEVWKEVNDVYRTMLARHRPQYQSVWADDIYMGVPFLTNMGVLTGDNKYFDDAVKQVLQMASRLYIPEKELFDHGWNVTSANYDPRFYWGRANGWTLMSMAERLSVLPENYEGRDKILDLYRSMIRSLANLQDGSGFWHNLLNKNDTYTETSCTAMFTYAIAKGINEGWISHVYGPVALTGWNATQTRVLENGAVDGTCEGTTFAHDNTYYYHRGKSTFATHGYGPVLYAGAEIIRLKFKKQSLVL